MAVVKANFDSSNIKQTEIIVNVYEVSSVGSEIGP